jgi:hypothetical protein
MDYMDYGVDYGDSLLNALNPGRAASLTPALR